MATSPPVFRDADAPARAPFQAQIPVPIVPGQNAPNATIAVPKQKHFVIEHVSAIAGLPSGQRVMFVGVNVIAGGTPATHFLPMHPTGTTSSTPGDWFAGASPVRLYADPQTKVTVSVSRSDTTGGGLTATVSLSGHLVDA